MENKFSEEDKGKVVDFLNMIVKHGRFDMTTLDIIKYFKLLNFMQTDLIPKIDQNVLEIVKYKEAAKSESGEGVE